MVNYTNLEDHFKQSELQAAALLTCGFDRVAFAYVSPYVDEDIRELAELLITHKVHLSTQGITFKDLLSKLNALSNSTSTYQGKSTKPFSWSGMHLLDSESFFGEIDKPVSVNEMDYAIKDTANLLALNPAFQDTINALGEEPAFVVTPDFDLQMLKGMAGVRKVTDDSIKLVGGIELPVVVVH